MGRGYVCNKNCVLYPQTVVVLYVSTQQCALHAGTKRLKLLYLFFSQFAEIFAVVSTFPRASHVMTPLHYHKVF